MGTEVETVIVNCSRDVAQDLQSEIATLAGSKSHVMQRKNLEGTTADLIVIASLTAKLVPHILSFIRGNLELGKIKKIKVGDIEIENPSDKDMEILRRMISAKAERDGDL